MPIALYGIGYIVARNSDSLPNHKSRYASEHIVFVALNARSGDATNDTFARTASVRNLRMHYNVLRLSVYREYTAQHYGKGVFQECLLRFIC